MNMFLQTKSKAWLKTYKERFPSLQREMNAVVAEKKFGPWVSTA